MNEDRDRFVLDRRYAAMFDSLDDDAIGALALALEEELRDGFARVVGLPSSAFEEGQPLGALVRDGIVKRRIAHDVGVILAEPCTQYSIEKLGDSADNPALEELTALLPEVIDKFGLDAVRLMVIQYSRSLKGFRQLVASDDRFAPPGSLQTAAVLEKDEAAQAAKRAARKERKAAERAVKAKQRGR